MGLRRCRVVSTLDAFSSMLSAQLTAPFEPVQGRQDTPQAYLGDNCKGNSGSLPSGHAQCASCQAVTSTHDMRKTVCRGTLSFIVPCPVALDCLFSVSRESLVLAWPLLPGRCQGHTRMPKACLCWMQRWLERGQSEPPIGLSAGHAVCGKPKTSA